MREYLTPDDICNQISMVRAAFDGTIMVVEGNTDMRLFKKFVDRDSVRIYPAHSKSNVRETVRKMSSDRKDGRLFGIVDSDLDRVDGRNVKRPLFQTDCRDMEMMVFKGSSLSDILDEYGDTEKIERFTSRFGPIKEAILSCSYFIGLLMHVSQVKKYGLNFSDLDFRRFVNRGSLEMDVRALVDTVVSNTTNPRVSRNVLLNQMEDESERLTDKWNVARGHDTMEILTIGLKSAFGAYNTGSLNSDMVSGMMRIGYDIDDFSVTELYGDVADWASEKHLKVWVNRCRSRPYRFRRNSR